MADLPESLRPQTLQKYLASYRDITQRHLESSIQTCVDSTTATKGAITNPERRLTPERIEPWTDFDRTQEYNIIATILREVDEAGADNFTFPGRHHIDLVAEDLGRLDSENALLLYDADTLHKPATRILRALLASDRIKTALTALARRQQQQQPHHTNAQHSNQRHFAYRQGEVSFTTHLNRLPQIAGSKRKRDIDQAPKAVLGPADVFCMFDPVNPPPTGSDNINVASSPSVQDSYNNDTELLFLKEAKASHKLTADIIEEAVSVRGNKTLDPRLVISRGVGGPDHTNNCEYWFTAVCAQIYASMINKSLRYGIISTGARYVFVCIDPKEVSTLRYSVCGNSLEIRVSPLIRVVSLALLAMQHGTLPADNDKLKSIQAGGGLIWTTATDSFTTVDSPDAPMREETKSYSPEEERDGSLSSSMSDQPSNYDTEQNPGQASTTTTLDAQMRESYPSPPPQGESILGKRCRQQEAGVDEDEPAKRTKADNGTDIVPAASHVSPTSPPTSPPQFMRILHRSFCTQKCLQFLISPDEQRLPDYTCPNYAEHERGGHLTRAQFCQNVQAQLGMKSTEYEFLNFTSGHTQMIILRLCSSGHVLLAKAFIPSKLKLMHREARFYARLSHLQGQCIPVCMGTIELNEVLGYDGNIFTGLLLLGSAGRGMERWRHIGKGLGDGGESDRAFVRTLTIEVRKALAEIHKAGVLHGDIELRNVLIQHSDFERTSPSSCPEWRLQVMIIDFELSLTRKMYRQRENRGRHGHRPKSELNKEFAEALTIEMDKCAGAMGKWCPKHRY